jgi:hypothetical protein
VGPGRSGTAGAGRVRVAVWCGGAGSAWRCCLGASWRCCRGAPWLWSRCFVVPRSGREDPCDPQGIDLQSSGSGSHGSLSVVPVSHRHTRDSASCGYRIGADSARVAGPPAAAPGGPAVRSRCTRLRAASTFRRIDDCRAAASPGLQYSPLRAASRREALLRPGFFVPAAGSRGSRSSVVRSPAWRLGSRRSRGLRRSGGRAGRVRLGCVRLRCVRLRCVRAGRARRVSRGSRGARATPPRRGRPRPPRAAGPGS